MTAAVRYAIGDPGRAALLVGQGRPADVPGWPDVDVHSTAAPWLDVRAASTRGLAHRYLGTPRQDACAVRWLVPGEVLVAVVCDGVGSLELSHEAAALVAADLPELLRDAVGGPLPWADVLAELSARIDARTPAGERPLMATTVAAAVLTRGVDGSSSAELAWVGDCAAHVLRAGAWVPVGAAPGAADGELHSSATAALPGDPALVGTASVELLPGDALFLMTDGVGLPLGAGRGEVGAALAEWWAAAPEPEDFAAQVDFARRTFDDDRTVVGMWRPAAEVAR